MKNIPVQLSKYIIVGGIAALINISIYNFLVYRTGTYFVIASVIGYLTGVCFNYFYSKKWVFRNTYENHIHQMGVFLVIATLGLVINSSALYMIVHFLKLSYFLSYILATGITFCWNFGAHKGITFNHLIFKNKVVYEEAAA